jgi:glycosyltransferase involved in cell wall biosynthesis
VQPKISIVIPTYNRTRTIRDAIDSVLRQTYSDFELIVVDDCSKDETRTVLASIADPRVRAIFREKNGGSSVARNTGARAAVGEWIAFQDSDDEWLPTKLEFQMARLEGGDYVAGYCGVVIFGVWDPSSGSRPSVSYFPSADIPLPDGDILAKLLRDSFISTQALVVRRHVLVAEEYFDPSTPPLEDWDLALRLARRGQIAFVDEPLVIQRFSPDSITRSRLNAVRARTRIVEKNLDLLASQPSLLAYHYHNIGGAWRDLGELGTARRYLLKALRLAPLAPRSLTSLGYTIWLDLYRRMAKPG